MSKLSTRTATQPRVSPVAAATPKVAPVTETKKVVAKAPASTETKVAKERRKDRPACLEVRKAMGNEDIIKKAKSYDGRQGTLRCAIVEAIQSAATVWDACKLEVTGPGKHESLPYRIKKVDVGFALANGYITVTPAPAPKVKK